MKLNCVCTCTCNMSLLFFCSQSPANVKRLAGYDIDPLRIDIMTTIEHSKLVHMQAFKICYEGPVVL